ncbi:MAG: 50S ribosomal protein L1 [Leptonema illini]|jgi:large subunit ribosomal protein L1|uniref:Large ribosomal subunit protein uL1 n=2 Tax=Leptonema illini TaxID=183 RepID=H2CAL6_9LEPT|nr:50S ribosomal protein L1 [Leptonema illini]EHQ08394.1 LSU ribosomal protein L1P [Leptonema illini DSM 21528]KAB2930220.1 MAG: 50S ribosomal protein L1 [Leptonema illini]PKL31666.1 MAG: 50S ribosomal protein L1 [Spirochaetae bacterium HGW-Spirochaetae-10]
MNRGKKWKAAYEKINPGELLSVEEAASKIGELSTTKFDGSVDASLKIGYKSLQNVRGIVRLPHGTGKNIRVCVIAKADKHAAAKEAGAEFVGAEDIIEKIQTEKWTDFDACIATPDMMPKIGKLGQILGRKGLMPKPKAGTVTDDVATAIKNVKAGQVEYKADKTGVVAVPVGRVSFGQEKLAENIRHLYQSIIRDKPSDAKGEYVKTLHISPTMGPALKINARNLI